MGSISCFERVTPRLQVRTPCPCSTAPDRPPDLRHLRDWAQRSVVSTAPPVHLAFPLQGCVCAGLPQRLNRAENHQARNHRNPALATTTQSRVNSEQGQSELQCSSCLQSPDNVHGHRQNSAAAPEGSIYVDARAFRSRPLPHDRRTNARAGRSLLALKCWCTQLL